MHTSIALVLAAVAFALNAETVIWNTGTEFNVDRDGANLPREGDVLDIRISNNKSFLVNATGDDVSFDGTVVITNRTASYAHPGVLIYRAHRAFSGKGTIITEFSVRRQRLCMARIPVVVMGSCRQLDEERRSCRGRRDLLCARRESLRRLRLHGFVCRAASQPPVQCELRSIRGFRQ